MKMYHHTLLLVCTTLVLLGSAFADMPPQCLDKLVTDLMKHDRVPGMALVVVKDGKVIVAKGYGTRTVGKQEKVDADTLFGLASTTKAFTSVALGMQVDKGTISFDSLVADVLPGFRVQDPYVSANVTVRDLLAHRTATDSADMMWYARQDMPRGDLIRQLKYVPQARSFRNGFVYSSLMYVAAGRILYAQTGETWEEHMQTDIFQPLGMRRTTTDMRGLGDLQNVASPYVSIEGGLIRIPHSNEVNTGPAGLIYSSANDVGRWLQFLLAGGSVDGQQLLSEETLADIMSPHFVVDDLSPFEELIYFDSSFVTTGLGWFISDYRGRKSLSHTGGMDGMAAFISILPSENLAVGVFANLERNMARVAIRNWIYDQYLGVSETDWASRYKQWSGDLWAGLEKMAVEARDQRNPNTSPSVPLQTFTGLYHDDLVGELQIELREDGELTARIGDIKDIPMQHWQNDTFKLTWANPLLNHPFPTLLKFKLDPDGQPQSVVFTGPAEVVFIRAD